MKKYIAEGLGTFTLTLVVALSIVGICPVPTPVLAALVLGLFVYSIGHISGCHINPAVTIGAWSIKKINTTDATGYIVAQLLGAGIALSLASSLGPVGTSAGIAVSNSLTTGLAELLGTFFFTFGIASVIYDRTPHDTSGAVIGGSLLLGITIATFLGSNGVLNPAVAFGIGSPGIMYILGPILGSVLGMQVYKNLES
ncbi:MAG: aquaporin [Minisyncoccia bacterium]